MKKQLLQLKICITELEKHGIALSLVTREEESIKNAKLIAASQKMLNTLRAVDGYLNKLSKEGRLDDDGAKIINSCKKAIKKATK